MIISSSNVSMESSRQYQSQQISGSSYSIGSQSSVTENLVSARQEESYKILNFTDMLKSEMIDDATADMENSMLGMRSGSAAAAKLSAKDALQDYLTVQKNTILYVLRNFRQLMKQGYQHQDRNGAMQVNSLNSLTDFLGLYQSAAQQTGQSSVIGTFSSYYGYSEEENTSFSTTGKVVTADGREIEFQVEVAMSRSFEEYYESQTEVQGVVTPVLVDPLVINLNSSAADVKDQKFLFDLDADGTEEEISMLGSGSGFLALDKNGDGIINDGSELFGTASGNGFEELAAFDEDGNGWIDENDPIFEKLKIWAKDENGGDVLYTLKQSGVGAICLQRAVTNFSMNSISDNATNAVVRQTGVFLYEDGTAGTVQHLDLAT